MLSWVGAYSLEVSLVVRLWSLLLLTLLSSLRAMLESIFMTTTPDRRPPLTAGASRRRRQHTTWRHRCGMRAAYLRAGRGYFWSPKPRLNHESDGVIRHAPFSRPARRSSPLSRFHIYFYAQCIKFWVNCRTCGFLSLTRLFIYSVLTSQK